MKKTLGILAAAFAAIVMTVTMIGCSDTSALQSDIDRLTDIVADLTDSVADLTDSVADLTEENENLTDKVNSLNVFTSDKAEYSETETMIVYFKNQPVLKIRLSFDNADGTPLWGRSFNFTVYITSLCTDIYDESIISTASLVWDQGSCVRKPASSYIIKQNVEKKAGGYFTETDEAYEKGTWFDLVICVPGTPFELARLNNLSHTK